MGICYLVVLDIKVKGDRHDALGQEGAVVRKKVVCPLDCDHECVYVGLGVDLFDLQLCVRDIDQALIHVLGRGEGCKEQDGRGREEGC